MNRKTILTARGYVVSALAAVLLSSSALAQTPEKFAARPAEINGNDVYVRSGPSANHYPVIKLAAGDRVSVVGQNGEWYEVVPPEGTFSFISGDFVDTADGKIGVVSGNKVRVRAGSVLPEFSKNKYVVQTKLSSGADVSILGRDPDGYLRIKPPTGVTVWVHNAYVSMLTADRAAAKRPSADSAKPNPEASDPNTSANQPAPSDAVAGTTESPSNEDWQFKGQKETPQRRTLAEIEISVKKELEKPAVDRDFATLIQRYDVIAEQTEDDFARRYAATRIQQLSLMASTVETVRSMQSLGEQVESKRREFLDERARIREELPPIPSGLDVQGVLRASALYPPGSYPERYRLVDPADRRARTIAYIEIRPNAALDVGPFLGRYVGVRSTGSRLLTGGIQPVPIYVVAEIVLLEDEDSPDDAPVESPEGD